MGWLTQHPTSRGGIEQAVGRICSNAAGSNVRVLIDESRDIVDLVVDNEEEVLLGLVVGNLLEGELLVGGHGCGFEEMKEGVGRWISDDKGDGLRRENRGDEEFNSTG